MGRHNNFTAFFAVNRSRKLVGIGLNDHIKILTIFLKN